MSTPEPAPGSTSRKATAKRTFAAFQADQVTDLAAALTYYAVLSIFPGLIALVSIVGLFGDPQATTRALTAIVADLGPRSATDTFDGPIQSLTANRGRAGVLLVAGTLGAIYSASSYIGGFIRAANRIYGVEEGRPFWKLRPLQISITVAIVVLLMLVAGALVLSGPVARSVGERIGLAEATVAIYQVAKWPLLATVVLAMLALLYHATPNVRLPRFRLITWGSGLALAVWIVASAGFALYVANFGSYDKTYGALGGVVSFLVWLWITNIAVLVGLELDAELERSRELEAGVRGASDEIQLPPRQAAG